eukprot:363029-Chlamydomonas_euryale.AAC.1
MPRNAAFSTAIQARLKKALLMRSCQQDGACIKLFQFDSPIPGSIQPVIDVVRCIQNPLTHPGNPKYAYYAPPTCVRLPDLHPLCTRPHG